MSTAQKIETLCAEQIRRELSVDALSRLYELEILSTINSTNTYVLQKSREINTSGYVCFAEEQTAGRGRLGRVWYSPRYSHIYCSLLWYFSEQDVSSLSIAIAVMINRALKRYLISQGIQLKWPNDVLYQGKKLAGILLEKSGHAVVIGIGLNVKFPQERPAEIAENAIDVASILQQTPNRNRLAGMILNELLLGISIYSLSKLDTFLDEWQQHDAFAGKEVMLQTPHECIHGRMQRVNAEGELVLEKQDGVIQAFRYGEVSVRLSSRA